jgi:co-chaperonin GroES (HSP10)
MTEVITGTIRPMGDKIFLRPLPWKPSETIDVVRFGRPVRGTIVAIGKGEHPKKYKRDRNGQKVSFEYSKHFRPTELKPGDVVEVGGLNIFDGDGYSFQEVVVNNETLLVCSEKDVACVCGVTE